MRTDRPLTLTVTEAGNLLGVSRSTAYELVRTGELDSIQLRRRVLVPLVAVAAKLQLTPADVLELIEPAGPTRPSRNELTNGRTGVLRASVRWPQLLPRESTSD